MRKTQTQVIREKHEKQKTDLQRERQAIELQRTIREDKEYADRI